ncbi:MAG: family 20 glycosylhydrolase [Acidobacteria bacterium]|nr:family 20 glycosylhydrolase [Acidobacteriota bacterium]
MALGVAVVALVATVTGAGDRPPLMPWPASIEQTGGELAIGPGFRVRAEGGGRVVARAAARFEGRLARQTGLVLPPPGPATGPPALAIRCEASGDAGLPHLGMDESYTLEVTPEGAVLRAPEAWGVLRGLETFLQMVTPGAEGLRVPAVVIEDAPRFPWRGLLLDSGRHFMPIEVVERTLDGLAAVKMNVLHWHLTEDQGFRVESRRYPRLQELGSDGRYYTQDEIRRVIAYAADRGIRVVPEFDIPGHTTSWFVGHPELATLPGPYTIDRHWGIRDPAMDPTREGVYTFLDAFLGEMASLFPDEFLHIGGDEVNGNHWDASEAVAAFKKEKGLADNHDLQAHFNARVSAIVTAHGKQMMGWDEILHPDLPRETVVQSWRGAESLARAAEQGFRGVLSNGYYVDLMQPAARHYAVEPYAKGADELSAAARARILGGEACMWAEYVNAETVDSRVWPRTAAIAERFWSPREVSDVEDMYARLEATSRWLEWLGLEHRTGYRRMLQRLAGERHEELRELADVVEPLEGYRRGDTGEYTSFTPLNRLVDAARPESQVARRFSLDVEALLADPDRAAGREEIRARLAAWQGLEGRLRSLLEGSGMLRELVPLAAEVSRLAGVGLEALGFVEEGSVAPEPWRAQSVLLLEEPDERPHALEVAFRPAVLRLFDAAQGETSSPGGQR